MTKNAEINIPPNQLPNPTDTGKPISFNPNTRSKGKEKNNTSPKAIRNAFNNLLSLLNVFSIFDFF